jgi:hypothetical protein
MTPPIIPPIAPEDKPPPDSVGAGGGAVDVVEDDVPLVEVIVTVTSVAVGVGVSAFNGIDKLKLEMEDVGPVRDRVSCDSRYIIRKITVNLGFSTR